MKDRSVKKAEGAIASTVENVREWAAPKLHAATEALAHGYEQVSPVIADGLNTAKEKAADMMEKVQDDVVPAAKDFASRAQESASETFTNAKTKATELAAQAQAGANAGRAELEKSAKKAKKGKKMSKRQLKKQAQKAAQALSLIHISEPTRLSLVSRMPSSA